MMCCGVRWWLVHRARPFKFMGPSLRDIFEFRLRVDEKGGPVFSYKGKKVAVTGGGRGIGRAIALAMAGRGADVCLSARTQEQLDSVADEIRAIGRNAWTLPVDLSDAAGGAAVVRQSAESMGGLDVLVSNAGGGSSVPGGMGPLEDATPGAFRAIYGLNLEAPFFACLEAIKVMKERGNGGRLLNIASIDGLFTAPGEALYGSAKAALISITESLAVEVGQYGIRVNAIAPSLIDTPLVARWIQSDEQRAARASYFPINRIGTPEDIASAALYLCSDEAGWVSGVTLLVAGGQQATSDFFRWVRAHNPVPKAMKI